MENLKTLFAVPFLAALTLIVTGSVAILLMHNADATRLTQQLVIGTMTALTIAAHFVAKNSIKQK